jgi:hypothetical protein
MEALEFSTKIKDGVIHLPKEFEEFENTEVRIIILTEKPQNVLNKKEKLKAVLNKIQEADVFSNIKNPVEWQKQLRSEWE